MRAGPAAALPTSTGRPGGCNDASSEPVCSLRRAASKAAAKIVRRLLSRLHFLIRHRVLIGAGLDEIAPAATVNPPAAEARIGRLHALLVLQRLEDRPARHIASRRNLWNTLRAPRDLLCG